MDSVIFTVYVAVLLVAFGLLVAEGVYHAARLIGWYQSRFDSRVIVFGFAVLYGAAMLAWPLVSRVALWGLSSRAHTTAGAWVIEQFLSHSTGIAFGVGLTICAVVVGRWLKKQPRPRLKPAAADDEVTFGR